MSVPVGVPIVLTDNHGNKRPAYWAFVDEFGQENVSYFTHETNSWSTTNVVGRDDTGATLLTYAVLPITTKFEGT